MSEMTFRRLHITGASGSGTTTLGQALAARLNFRHCDADDYYWLPTQPPFQVKREKEERLRLILDDLAHAPGGVVSGSVCRWGAALEDSFDMIIYLRIPAEVRLERLRAREIIRHGKINEEFIAWAARYDEGDLLVRSRRLHEDWLSSRQCEILRLEEDMSVDDRVTAVLRKMQRTAVE